MNIDDECGVTGAQETLNKFQLSKLSFGILISCLLPLPKLSILWSVSAGNGLELHAKIDIKKIQ